MCVLYKCCFWLIQNNFCVKLARAKIKFLCLNWLALVINSLILTNMKLKTVYKLEKKAKEVWIVSPDLHYDTENDAFKNIVVHNLHDRTKYRYIVPNTNSVNKHLNKYQKDLTIPKDLAKEMFLLLPPSEFIPFMSELAIYDPNSKTPVACMAVWKNCDESDEIIRFDVSMTRELVNKFRKLWIKYKREKP